MCVRATSTVTAAMISGSENCIYRFPFYLEVVSFFENGWCTLLSEQPGQYTRSTTTAPSATTAATIPICKRLV